MKTADLIGDDLDLWVARAVGHTVQRSPSGGWEVLDAKTGHLVENTDYSTDWAHGGPVVEREQIDLYGYRGLWMPDGQQWRGSIDHPAGLMAIGRGPTPLIAAMRAYVASKFGEEVPDA